MTSADLEFRREGRGGRTPRFEVMNRRSAGMWDLGMRTEVVAGRKREWTIGAGQELERGGGLREGGWIVRAEWRWE